MKSSWKARAVFLDRDGVLIEEKDYLRRPEDLRLTRGAAKAVADLRRGGFKVVVVSNQSAVARGLLTLSGLARITRRLRSDLVKENPGALLDAVYYCPHHPGFGPLCSCRKPEIGLIVKAQKRFGIDLKSSYLVGDSSADFKAAADSGCVPLAVKTGYGGRDGRHPAAPARIFPDLSAAARWILKNKLH